MSTRPNKRHIESTSPGIQTSDSKRQMLHTAHELAHDDNDVWVKSDDTPDSIPSVETINVPSSTSSTTPMGPVSAEVRREPHTIADGTIIDAKGSVYTPPLPEAKVLLEGAPRGIKARRPVTSQQRKPPPSNPNKPPGNSSSNITPGQAAIAALQKLQQQRPSSQGRNYPPGASSNASGTRIDAIQKALTASKEATRLAELERQQRAKEEAEREMQRRMREENDRIIWAAQDAERDRRRKLEVDYEFAKLRGQNPMKPPSSRAPKEELELNVERMQQLLPPDCQKLHEADKRTRDAVWAKRSPLLDVIPDQGDIINSIERDIDEYDEHRIAAVSRGRIRDSIVADLLADRVSTPDDDATHKEFVDDSLVQAASNMEEGEIA